MQLDCAAVCDLHPVDSSEVTRTVRRESMATSAGALACGGPNEAACPKLSPAQKTTIILADKECANQGHCWHIWMGDHWSDDPGAPEEAESLVEREEYMKQQQAAQAVPAAPSKSGPSAAGVAGAVTGAFTAEVAHQLMKKVIEKWAETTLADLAGSEIAATWTVPLANGASKGGVVLGATAGYLFFESLMHTLTPEEAARARFNYSSK